MDSVSSGELVRSPNVQLRAARQAVPSKMVPGECMGRAELAEAVNSYLWEATKKRYCLDAHTIARYERGVVRWPSGFYRSGLRAALGVGSDIALGFRQASRRSNAIFVNSTAPTKANDESNQSPQSVEAALLAAMDESAQFLTWAEVENVGDLTIDQIHNELRRIASDYLKVPTMPLFARTRAVRDRVFGFLSGHQKPSRSRDLYSAAGWSLTVLAWMSADLGHPDIAEEHLRVAWLCAENADQNNLRAWVRATQHTAAYLSNDFRRAAHYAETGLTYAGRGSVGLFLTSALALDLAKSGDRQRAREVFIQGQNSADAADAQADELEGPFRCSVDRAIGGLWSETFFALGEPSKALGYADRAVSGFESTPNGFRNFGSERMVRCQQVKAHLMLGELDGASESLVPVLTTLPEHRVLPLVQRVGEIAQIAEGSAQRAESEIVAMGEAIADFRGNSDPKSLSS